jgi:hypothetical protein
VLRKCTLVTYGGAPCPDELGDRLVREGVTSRMSSSTALVSTFPLRTTPSPASAPRTARRTWSKSTVRISTCTVSAPRRPSTWSLHLRVRVWCPTSQTRATTARLLLSSSRVLRAPPFRYFPYLSCHSVSCPFSSIPIIPPVHT